MRESNGESVIGALRVIIARRGQQPLQGLRRQQGSPRWPQSSW